MTLNKNQHGALMHCPASFCSDIILRSNVCTTKRTAGGGKKWFSNMLWVPQWVQQQIALIVHQSGFQILFPDIWHRRLLPTNCPVIESIDFQTQNNDQSPSFKYQIQTAPSVTIVTKLRKQFKGSSCTQCCWWCFKKSPTPSEDCG